MTTESRVSIYNNQTILFVQYDRTSFDKKIKTPSGFYKSLSNSKSTLPNGINNRNWWKLIKPKGFYKYKINEEIIELTFVLTTITPINEIELKSRVKKIGIPIRMEVSNNLNVCPIDENLKNREGVEKFGWSNPPSKKHISHRKYVYG
jgi:hypothetical protein